MACFRCGAIMEYASVAFEKLKREMAKRSGFQIRVVRLEVGGLCERCGKAAS
jgi:Fe2+ or Zn2+ uptake regulation protein